MPSRGLPVNIDSAYVDDTAHPDVKIHQQHHDVIHAFVNTFDNGAPPDGSIFFFDAGTGLWTAIDPNISGSPGPQGIQGRGIRYRGAWSAATAYVIYNGTTVFADDIVTSNGATYIALNNSTNSQPPSSNWGLLAAAGVDGTDGADGPPGPTGPPGIPGPAAEELVVIPSATGTLLLDAAVASFFRITLANNLTINLDDLTSNAVSAITVELHQGSGAPWTVTWGTAITWFTENGLAPALATQAGLFDVITFYQVNGEWRGFTPGGAGTAPPFTYPTLGLEILVHEISSADVVAGGPYNFTTSAQLGNQRGGLALVEITRGDSIHPAVPSLAGGGASSWIEIKQSVHGVGTTRRRFTLFAARDAVTGVAAPLTVTPGSPDTHTGCAVHMVRSTGVVPGTWVATALANSDDHLYSAAGETQAACKLTAIVAPVQAANRIFVGVAGNNAAVLTPDDFTILQTDGPTGGNPAMKIWSGWNPSAFVVQPSGVLSLNTEWAMLGCELVQG